MKDVLVIPKFISFESHLILDIQSIDKHAHSLRYVKYSIH